MFSVNLLTNLNDNGISFVVVNKMSVMSDTVQIRESKRFISALLYWLQEYVLKVMLMTFLVDSLRPVKFFANKVYISHIHIYFGLRRTRSHHRGRCGCSFKIWSGMCMYKAKLFSSNGRQLIQNHWTGKSLWSRVGRKRQLLNNNNKQSITVC